MGANVVPFQGKKVATAFASLNPTEESLSDGVGSSYPVISYRGGKWTLRYRGEDKLFLREDGSPTNTLNVIILRQAKTKSKSYFEKYDQKNPNKPPLCTSMNGVVPDAGVAAKQAEACGVCPRNVWHKNSEGRNTRDCTDYKRLAVLIHPEQTKLVLGAPLMEPAFLRIPPASLQDLGTFGDRMGQQGYFYCTYVTEIKFDSETEYPKMIFREVALLSDEEAPLIVDMRESATALRITGEDQEHRAAAPAITEAPAPKQLAVGAGLLAASKEASKVIEGEVLKPKVAPVQTAADTGVDESDDELDAQINAMLKKKH